MVGLMTLETKLLFDTTWAQCKELKLEIKRNVDDSIIGGNGNNILIMGLKQGTPLIILYEQKIDGIQQLQIKGMQHV